MVAELFMKRIAWSLLLLALLAAPLRAADPAAEIQLQRTLDAPFDLALDKVELAEAFKAIASKAKISMQVDPACYDLLPYGSTTRVSATFRQSKLREAIEEVLLPLGLEQHVAGPTVMIRPSKPLARTGRRAQWAELELLRVLRTTELTANEGDFDLTKAISAATERPQLLVEIERNAGPAHAAALDQLKKQLPVSGIARALDTYASLTNQTWFVENNTIRIMTVRKWIERQMARPIDLKLTNVPLERVVTDLSYSSGIRFVPEPGLYQSIRNVSVNSNNGTVLQTLEALSGATGLVFETRDDSVLLVMAGRTPTAPATSRDTIIGRIAVPVNGGAGTTLDIFVRESDLSPEMNELRKKKVAEAIEQLQKQWLTPTSQPASQPAAASNEK